MTFALPLPNGRQQFLDADGAPLVDGYVYHYVPGTLVAKDTWQDFAASERNDNPLRLDALGSASIWGIGRYRQIVTDSLGNQIWDRETAVLTNRPYEVGFYFPDAGSAGNVVGKWFFTQAVTFATNFDGSYGGVNTLPSTDITLDIKRNGSIIGAMNISDAGAVTFTSNITDPAFVAGDYISWVVQGGGAAASAGYGATLLGELTSA
jgi:hypothetical protein